ncbi:MAG TPA: carbohydrate ABC transporter permease [Aggregatilineaceae bacterium]|nr:carbohydrate ABC transporter permease [Aggregatilineaceae bacterium]
MIKTGRRLLSARPQGRTKGTPVRQRTVRVMLYVLLTTLVLVYSIPGIGVIITSLKTNREISREGVWTAPDRILFGNYTEAWNEGNVKTYSVNSFLVTIPATIASILFGVLTGYVLSKLPFQGSQALFIFIVAGMFYPPQIVLIPLFRLFNEVKLYDTLWPMIIVHTAFGLPICTLLMRNFFATVPNAVREAAIIDGANEGQILMRVMLPLSLPALAVLGTLQFTWIWNDFLWPLIFTQSDTKRTIMVGIITMRGQYSVAWGVQGAMSVIASIPTLLIFVFFQRYFIRGLTLGAVKG